MRGTMRGGGAGFLMDVVWRHGGLKRLVGSQLNLAFVFFFRAFTDNDRYETFSPTR